MEASIRARLDKYHLEKNKNNVLLLKLMYSVIIQWYTKIHVKKIASHCFQFKYLYAIKMRLISIN